jgi:hypothetical protein
MPEEQRVHKDRYSSFAGTSEATADKTNELEVTALRSREGVAIGRPLISSRFVEIFTEYLARSGVSLALLRPPFLEYASPLMITNAARREQQDPVRLAKKILDQGQQSLAHANTPLSLELARFELKPPVSYLSARTNRPMIRRDILLKVQGASGNHPIRGVIKRERDVVRERVYEAVSSKQPVIRLGRLAVLAEDGDAIDALSYDIRRQNAGADVGEIRTIVVRESQQHHA